MLMRPQLHSVLVVLALILKVAAVVYIKPEPVSSAKRRPAKQEPIMRLMFANKKICTYKRSLLLPFSVCRVRLSYIKQDLFMNIKNLPLEVLEIKDRKEFEKMLELCIENPGGSSPARIKDAHQLKHMLTAADFLELDGEHYRRFSANVAKEVLLGPRSSQLLLLVLYGLPERLYIRSLLLYGFLTVLGLELRAPLPGAVQEGEEGTFTLCAARDPDREAHGPLLGKMQEIRRLKITPDAWRQISCPPPGSLPRLAPWKRPVKVLRAARYFLEYLSVPSLDVSSCGLSEADLARLLDSEYMKSGLQSLDISHNIALGPKSITALEALRSLRELKMAGCRPDSSSLARILDSEALKMCIHTLDVSEIENLEESGLVEKIAALRNLRALFMRECSLRAGSLAIILSAQQIRESLCTLDVSLNKNLDLADRQRMADLQALKALTVKGCSFAAGSLAEILRGTQLKKNLCMLDITWNEKSNSEDRKAIADLQALQHLLMEGFRLRAHALAAILGSQQFKKNLRTLDVSWIEGLDPKACRAIARLMALQHLIMEGCKLAEGLLAIILSGNAAKNLRTLNVTLTSNLNLEDKKRIADLEVLEHLVFQTCNLAPGSLAGILRRRQLKKSLRTLNVSYNTRLSLEDHLEVARLEALRHLITGVCSSGEETFYDIFDCNPIKSTLVKLSIIAGTRSAQEVVRLASRMRKLKYLSIEGKEGGHLESLSPLRNSPVQNTLVALNIPAIDLKGIDADIICSMRSLKILIMKISGNSEIEVSLKRRFCPYGYARNSRLPPGFFDFDYRTLICGTLPVRAV